MTVESDLALLDESNELVYRESTIRGGGRVDVHDGLTMIIGTHPSPVIVNTIFRSGPVHDPSRALAFALEAYTAIGHGVTLVVSSHADSELALAARAAGWRQVFELVGMILDEPIGLMPGPPEATISVADPVADLAALKAIEVAGFAENDDERSMVESVFSDPRLLAWPGTAAFLASVGDPRDRSFVSAAIVDRAPAALITWVATLPVFRRRGLGGLVSAAAANRGFEMGCHAVVLQASPLGLPVYRRLGFRELGSYQILEPPQA